MSRRNKKTTLPGKGPGAMWFLLLMLCGGLMFLFWYNSLIEHEQISFSTFLTQVESGNVANVQIQEQQVIGEFRKPVVMPQAEGKVRNIRYFGTTVVSPDTLWEKLHKHDVHMQVYPQDRQSWGYAALLMLLPFFMLALYFLMRQGQGGGSSGKIFSVGKSKARFFSPNTIKIKFKDVAGVHEAKEDLKDIVEFLKNPEKFRKLGAKIPRGVLLTGAPGNGKTMLAKAVAGEASCPFFSVSGSDFVEVFVGVGASRVRDLFAQARRHAPCIIFIDEIDAVGRHRGVGTGGGSDEREQTLNQLLAEMDGFSTERGSIIVLAATNRPDVLDKALLRPGRFDRKVDVPYPDWVSREQILRIHVKGVSLADNIDLSMIARGTSQFSGADIANLVNEAALLASKKNKTAVDIDDFESARDKIIVGAERKTLTRTPEDMRRTAYHEAGHTLVSVMLPETAPLHKVTILSRGNTLGVTWSLPKGDDISRSEVEMHSEIMVALGGRIAEEIIYGVERRTTGAYSDLKHATDVARSMVRLYAMSGMGLMSVDPSEHVSYSEATARRMDEEVNKILDNCYREAKDLVVNNRERLDKLAQALVDKETLDAAAVYELLDVPPKALLRFTPEDDQKDAGEQSPEPVIQEG